jgi:hypothetical protein
MKLAKLFMVVCLSIILLIANAYSQTTDTKKPATAVKPKAQKPEVQKPKVQRPAPKKNTNVGRANTKASKSKASSKRRSDVPDIPLTNARITFAHTEFDFGSVPKGAKVTHHFPVSNTGPDTLIITKIKAG